MTTPLVESRGTLRPMLRLALPTLAQQMLSMLVLLSDTLLTGQYLTPEHLAAMNLMAYVLPIFGCLLAMVDVGATALVARFVGGQEWDNARHVCNQAMLLGTMLVVPMVLAGFAFGEPLVLGLRLEGESADFAVQYLKILLPSLPAMMVVGIGTSCLRGAGDTVSGMVAMIVVNVVNVTLSWTSVLCFENQPSQQWEGIAWGTAAGYFVGGAIVLLLLVKGRAGMQLQSHLLRPDFDLWRRILRVGIPGGFDVLAVILCQMWFVRIVNELGTVASAAHGIALKIEALSYLPGSAFQIAATTLAGQYLGAKDERGATRSVLMALAVGGGLMTVAGLAFFFIPRMLVAIFINAEQVEVAAAAAPLLRIIAFGTPTLAVMMVLSGALRGAGDTRWPLLVTLVGFLVFRIPTALFLTQHSHWGVEGAWWAMVVDITARCLLVTYRFWHGGWKKTVV